MAVADDSDNGDKEMMCPICRSTAVIERGDGRYVCTNCKAVLSFDGEGYTVYGPEDDCDDGIDI